MTRDTGSLVFEVRRLFYGRWHWRARRLKKGKGGRSMFESGRTMKTRQAAVLSAKHVMAKMSAPVALRVKD